MSTRWGAEPFSACVLCDPFPTQQNSPGTHRGEQQRPPGQQIIHVIKFIWGDMETTDTQVYASHCDSVMLQIRKRPSRSIHSPLAASRHLFSLSMRPSVSYVQSACYGPPRSAFNTVQQFADNSCTQQGQQAEHHGTPSPTV